jgi:hypothetical protein
LPPLPPPFPLLPLLEGELGVGVELELDFDLDLPDFDFDFDFDLDFDFDFDLDFDLELGAAVVVVVAAVVVVVVVVVPVVVVGAQLPLAGIKKSPWRRCAGRARSETTIGTKGFFFDPVRWQSMTLPGFEPVVVVVVVEPVVVVVPVVVVSVVVVVVVVSVEPCCCVCVLATAIDVAKPATRSASRIALGFMMAAFLQGGCVAGLLV